MMIMTSQVLAQSKVDEIDGSTVWTSPFGMIDGSAAKGDTRSMQFTNLLGDVLTVSTQRVGHGDSSILDHQMGAIVTIAFLDVKVRFDNRGMGPHP